MTTLAELCNLAIKRIAKEDFHLETLEVQCSHKDYSAQSIVQIRDALSKAYLQGAEDCARKFGLNV